MGIYAWRPLSCHPPGPALSLSLRASSFETTVPSPSQKDIGLDPEKPDTRLYATSAPQPIHNDGAPAAAPHLACTLQRRRLRPCGRAARLLAARRQCMPSAHPLSALVPNTRRRAACSQTAWPPNRHRSSCRQALRTWSPCCAWRLPRRVGPPPGAHPSPCTTRS